MIWTCLIFEVPRFQGPEEISNRKPWPLALERDFCFPGENDLRVVRGRVFAFKFVAIDYSIV